MVFDGRRVTDGAYVYMKRISQTRGKGVPDELEILQYLLSEPLRSDPRNRSMPILDILHIPNEPGEMVVVTPMFRPFYSPKFQTFGEAVAFFTQIFEVCFYPYPFIDDAKLRILMVRPSSSCMSIALFTGECCLVMRVFLTLTSRLEGLH